LTGATAALANAPAFSSGKISWADGTVDASFVDIPVYGTLTGVVTDSVTLNGTAKFTDGGFTGALNVSSGYRNFENAEFIGTSATITTSGTPNGSLTTTDLGYVKSVVSATAGIKINKGSIHADKDLLDGIKYDGAGTAATITPTMGDVKATGTEVITYAKATSAEAIFTPSGTITTTKFQPTGSITTSVTPVGTIKGTAVLEHTHTAGFTGTLGTVTVTANAQ
jgi:hypothetical protein